MPTILNMNGIAKHIEIDLDEAEIHKLQFCQSLKKNYQATQNMRSIGHVKNVISRREGTSMAMHIHVLQDWRSWSSALPELSFFFTKIHSFVLAVFAINCDLALKAQAIILALLVGTKTLFKPNSSAVSVFLKCVKCLASLSYGPFIPAGGYLKT